MIEFLEQCHQALVRDPESIPYEYFLNRGVTPDQMTLFKLGFIDPTVSIPSSILRSYPRPPVGKIVMPITDTMGNFRGIQTRSIEEKRYDTVIPDKLPYEPIFFGTSQAMESIWETKAVYLVEGPFDFFPVQRVFPNTLCTLTARLTKQQDLFLSRFVKHCVLVFDRDDKGRSTMDRLKDINNTSDYKYLIHELSYPGKDPGEFFQNYGYERFSSYLRNKASGLNLYL